MPIKLKTEIRIIWKLVIRNLPVLVLFEVLYRVATVFTISFLAHNALNLTLRIKNSSYMTSENFTEIMLHPLNVVMFAGIVVLFLLSMLFEMCGIMTILETSWKREKTTLLLTIYQSLLGCGRYLKRHPVSAVLTLAGAAPYLSLHCLLPLFSNVQLLQVAVQKIYGAFPHGSIPIVLLAIWLISSVLFAYTIPFRLMMDEKEKKIRQRTLDAIRSKWKGELLVNGFCQLLIALINLLVYFLAILIMVLVVYYTKKASTQISSVLVFADWIRIVDGVAASAFGMVVSLCYLYSFFLRTPRNKYKKSRFTKRKKKRYYQVLSKPWLGYLLAVILLTAEAIISWYLIATKVPSPTASANYISVSAHRGGARMAPENTLSSIDYAIDIMADYAEIDVQETKDGYLVLLHDNTLKRTTGLKANIWDLTLDEVRQLDAGAKFNKKFVGEKIPTLDEVIDEAYGRIKLNIEIKYNGHNDGIVRKVVHTIEQHGFVDQCVLTSMNYTFLKKAKELNPDIKTGYTMKMTYGNLEHMDAADFFSVKNTYIDDSFVRQVHALGKEVLAWTLNYQGDIQRMVNCGVDNIITDDPELVRKVITGEVKGARNLWDLLLYALK